MRTTVMITLKPEVVERLRQRKRDTGQTIGGQLEAALESFWSSEKK